MTAWHALEGTAVCYTVALSAAAAEAAVQLNKPSMPGQLLEPMLSSMCSALRWIPP